MRLRWNSIGLAIALIGCTKRNPNVCCETDAECSAVGYNSPAPCELGVCVARNCVESGCDGDEDCVDPDAPHCESGTCAGGPSGCEQAGGRIVFVSNRDGDDDLIVANADGTAAKAITLTAAYERGPRWSADGMKLAFTRDVAGGRDVFVANADGSAAANVTSSPESETYVEWSKDSALACEASSTSTSAFVIQVNGSVKVPLTSTGASDSGAPSWSPDGTKVVFRSRMNVDPFTLHVIGADGSGMTRFPVATMGEGDARARWSPDGRKIAFVSDRDGSAELWIADASGTNLTNVLAGVPLDSDLAWSPDSSMIAFVRQATAFRDIWTIGSDGTGALNVTQDLSVNELPRWSPDGQHLIFESTRDGNREVYRMRRDGTQLVNLSNDPSTDGSADWTACAAN